MGSDPFDSDWMRIQDDSLRGGAFYHSLPDDDLPHAFQLVKCGDDEDGFSLPPWVGTQRQRERSPSPLSSRHSFPNSFPSAFSNSLPNTHSDPFPGSFSTAHDVANKCFSPMEERNADAMQEEEDANQFVSMPNPPVTPRVSNAEFRRKPNAISRKKEPSSKKAAQCFKQNELKAKFGPYLRVFSVAPFLRDTEHAVFSCMPQVALAHLHARLREFQSEVVHVCDEETFVQTATKPSPRSIVKQNVCNSDDEDDAETSKCAFCGALVAQWAIYLCCVTATHAEPIAFYFNASRRLCYALEFSEDPTVDVDSDSYSVVANPNHVHVSDGAIRGFAKRHFGQDHPLEIQRAPLVNFVTCSKFFPTFHPTVPHKKTLWQVLCALLCLHFLGEDRFETPLQSLTLVTALSPPDKTALLHCFGQSLLYEALNNIEGVTRALKRLFPKLQAQHKTMFHHLQAQRSTKPSLPFRKQHDGRIGKFKGRQNEATFCIVINRTVGIYVTMDQLRTQSLPQLLVHAASQPNESEFSYVDLARKLPMLFPKKEDACFGSAFEMRSPFLATRDPTLCFGPVIHTLWPNITSDEQLVQLNGKRWKLEFEILQTTNSGGLVVGVNSGSKTDVAAPCMMTLFLEATQWSPKTMFHNEAKVDQWVSVVNAQDAPYGIFYRDEDATLNMDLAAQHIQRAKGWATTRFQFPHPVLSSSGTQTKGMIRKVAFFLDPYHLTWTGNREHGLAVRKHFRKGGWKMITFETWNQFTQSDPKFDTHVYRMVNDIKLTGKSNDNAAIYNATQLRHLVCEKTDLRTKLVMADDMGPPQILIAGHEPRLVSWQQCRFCTTAETTKQWIQNMLELSPARVHNRQQQPSVFSGECTQYALVSGPFQNVREDTVCGDLQSAIQARIKHRDATPCAQYIVTAVRNTNLVYASNFERLEHIVFEHLLKEAQQAGVEHFKLVGAQNYAEAQLPKQCMCCPMGSICLTALAKVIALLQSKRLVQTVVSNVPELHGKQLLNEAMHIKIGLRCKHNWTNGLDVGHIDLVVQAADCTSPQPDLLVCRQRCHAVLSNVTTSTLQLVLL